jgi:ureidoacrylate peracid hydrolase
MHPFRIPQHIVDRVMERRGRLNVVERLDPERTALIVIDMQNAFLAAGAAVEVPAAREIVPNINRLAQAARKAGGTVVWVQMTIPDRATWPVFFDSTVGPDRVEKIIEQLRPGSRGHALWPELETGQGDLVVAKNRFSAFLPSASELTGILTAKGIDTVIIAGTLTNVCCESSARDAVMLNFRTMLVSDANAARSDEEHMATLVTFVQSFGDVRTTEEVIGLYGKASDPPGPTP